MHNIQTRMGISNWLMLVLLSIIWGGSFFFVGVAVGELGTFTIVMLRLTIGALCLWGYIRVCGITVPSDISVWLSFLYMGIFNNAIPFSLIVWAQSHITSGLASILNATTPIFTVLIAGLFLKDEALNTYKIVGVITGFCGVVVLMRPSMLQDVNEDIVAQLAMLGATLSYGFASTFGRRFRQMNVDPKVVATGQLTCSSVILIVLAFIFDQPLQILDASALVLLSIFSLAAVSTALAYILYFRILSSSGAVNISLVTLLVPVSAILLGVTLLDETLVTEHYIGMLIIGLGLILIDGRLWLTLCRQNNRG